MEKTSDEIGREKDEKHGEGIKEPKGAED